MEKVKKGLGTAPVFFTAISTILGAILFLRFGYAVGTLGFWGVLAIIILGHLVTIPTALAISEIATNRRVEGGGEYFIISRSFGLNIGATIGIALYLSQAISVAFYVIAFSEAFSPVFNYLQTAYNINLPAQVVSLPTMMILGFFIIKKGSKIGLAALYFVVLILLFSLLMFFLGNPSPEILVEHQGLFSKEFRNPDQFFIVFAIIFPAFTGMTAGVGLSGDLKNARKSIPLGSTSATLLGMLIYILVIWKLSGSASVESLLDNQLVMSDIALWGSIVIPFGLAASTLSSAIGSVLVAPRTIQAIGVDKSFPNPLLNRFFSRGTGENNEPRNGSIVTVAIALVFVALGDVNAVAGIISMFFMVTYGSICLISFLHHFGADPSYRPTFKSRWYLSLLGFILCIWLMFKMNATYAFLAISVMIALYLFISSYQKNRSGLESIFQNAIFQLVRRIHVYIQQSRKRRGTWRPSAVCISEDSFQRDKAFNLLNWISHKHGFGTYIHLIKGYFSKVLNQEANVILGDLISKSLHTKGNIYVDTIISPSYTSAIAQVLQLPNPSGLENNMIIFEYERKNPLNLPQILDNISLTQAGNFDMCVLSSSARSVKPGGEIHIWIRNLDEANANLMILLSYIILGHPDWAKSKIKIFNVSDKENLPEIYHKMDDLVITGRLPVTKKNIKILQKKENVSFKTMVNEKSRNACLLLVGLNEQQLKNDKEEVFEGYNDIGDILFVLSNNVKEIY